MLKRIAFTFCLGFALLTTGCGKDAPVTPNGAAKGGNAKPTGGTTPKGPSWLDTAYIPDDAFAVVVVHPKRILEAELLKSAPMDEPLQEIQENLGIDPRTIEQIVLSVVPIEPDKKTSAKTDSVPPLPTESKEADDSDTKEAEESDTDEADDTESKVGDDTDPKEADEPEPEFEFEEPATGPPISGGAVIRFSEPYDKDKIGGFPFSKGFREEKELNGKKYFESLFGGMYFIDDKTVLIFDSKAASAFLGKQVTGKSPVIDALNKADGDQDIVVVIKPDAIKDEIPAGDELPPIPDLQDAVGLAKHIDTLTISGSLSPNLQLKVASTMDDAESAKKVQELVQKYLGEGKKEFAKQKSEIAAALPEELGKKAVDVLQKLIDSIQPTAAGKDFTVAVTAPDGFVELAKEFGPILEEQQKMAGRKTQNKNNFKQIGLAMHNYHEVHNGFPAAASVDADGKPLLSWRVHLLPFLEQESLYAQFNLDEPWDSENNKPLIEQMPDIFLKPGAENTGKTVYLVPVSEGALFAGKEGPKFRDVTDGTSNTVMAIEVAEDSAVIWTKPDDLKFDPEKPFANLPDEFIILFSDGAARGYDNSLDPETLRAIMTMAGGEPVELP